MPLLEDMLGQGGRDTIENGKSGARRIFGGNSNFKFSNLAKHKQKTLFQSYQKLECLEGKCDR
jgi:hypothetical protein